MKILGLFILVGCVNTLIDFFIFNWLKRPPFRFGRIQANICSVSVAMTFSFWLNFHFVFSPLVAHYSQRAFRFVAVTMTGTYGLQNIVIYLAGRSDLIDRISRYLHSKHEFFRRFEEEFLTGNAMKMLATGVGLVWNFVLYKYFVYAS